MAISWLDFPSTFGILLLYHSKRLFFLLLLFTSFFNMQYCNRSPTVVNFILNTSVTLWRRSCYSPLQWMFRFCFCLAIKFYPSLSRNVYSLVATFMTKSHKNKWINIYDGERDDFFLFSCTFFRSLTFNLVIHLHQTDVDVNMFRFLSLPSDSWHNLF